MYFSQLLGDNLFTATFFWIAVTGVAILFFLTGFAILYHKILYQNVVSKSYKKDYYPQCSIILPCKGIPANFENNISSFLRLNYEKYKVFYTVESDTDPAVPIIKKVINGKENAKLVVAGISTTCSQKNHNMLKAIEHDTDAEILVFADSDIALNDSWLKELVNPLSSRDITVTTGFRWLYSSTGKKGELSNVYQNTILYVIFSFVSFFNNIGLWGGSMAMRKKNFFDLGVDAFWNETVVDDMSLSALIMKKSKKSVMVSSCVVPTNDALSTLAASISWFERQVMFLKLYQKPQWFIAIPLVIGIMAFHIWLPISIILSYTTEATFLALGGASSLVAIFGVMATMLLYPFLGKQPHFFKSVLLQPLSLQTINIAILRTAFTNTVTWAGIKYKMNFKGKVVSIKR